MLQFDSPQALSAFRAKMEAAGLAVHPVDSHPLVVSLDVDKDTQPLLVQTLVDFVFNDWCCLYLCQHMAEAYDYLTEDEREYIALLTLHGLRTSDARWDGLTAGEWRHQVTAAVQSQLANGAAETPLNMGGLARFRARGFLRALDLALKDAVEQFLADKEYEEFVAMLRYMLDAQPPTMQVLHVYCTDDRVWITDAAGKLVRDPAVADAAAQVSDGEDVNAEDLAMSILITHAPCAIIIHDLTVAAPWPSFAETVEKVFIARATRCGNCSTCRQLQVGADAARDTAAPRRALPKERP
ncbi:sporulation protein YtxC [Alicyclobacillus contaminans]|uniref:sporulation protein YtxC n=1 Tax=Alicyclobacillus contaminans TaxID=392016 RepID=UPI00146FC054|nr:sporulation protein YtxC [Alicyclobacillus contaminans]